MERQEFEQIVRQSWLRIPPRFRRQVENLAIVVEQEPSRALLRSSGVRAGDALLGLYQGVPLGQRGSGYQLALPDKITLFQGPIERAARGEEEIPRIVYDTLWHEVGHYFGMSEPQIRAAERRRGALPR